MNPAEQYDLEAFNGAWTYLSEGLEMMFKREYISPKYYMELYQAAYSYCTSQPCTTLVQEKEPLGNENMIGKQLYEALCKYIGEQANRITEEASEHSGESLLEYYTSQWDSYRFSSQVVNSVFGYLNRHWIRRQIDEGKEGIYPIYSSALQVFKTKTFDPLETKIMRAIFEEIRKERTGDTINSRLISATLQSMQEMGLDKIDIPTKAPLAKDLHIYKDSFETPYFELTREFYTNEVQEFLQTGEPDCKEYMRRVWQRIQQEEHRVSAVFHSSTLQGLKDVCNEVMITHQLEFMQSQFGPLLVEKADEDLGRMYNLCSRVPTGLDCLRKALQAHVTKEGHSVLEERAQEALQDPKVYVQAILQVHERYEGLVERAFSREPGFMKALDSAAIDYINSNAVTKKVPLAQQILKSAELIARYCDGIMKKNSKMADDTDSDVTQKKMITIFKYLEDKDIFLKFYTRHFSKRLISDLSASDEAERSFIARLTECCGHEYTHRLTKMVQDCEVSKDLTLKFKETANEGKRMEFSVQVLSSGAWPAFPNMLLTLPRVLSASVEGFKEFYDSKFTGRKLQWVHGQSRGEVICSAFKGKKYVFGATTAQMCTLLMFNDATTYPAEALMNGTGMEAKTASTVVGSLVKHQVLSSDVPLAQDLTVPMTAKISLNSAYTNKKVRVDLSKMTAVVQAAKDAEHVKKGVEEDRNNVISACIVRILKARKTLAHQHLMTEVIAQLSIRFKPKVESIKKAIGSLIEKEYMKRNDAQRDMYDYMA